MKSGGCRSGEVGREVTHGILDLVLDDVEGVLRGGHALIALRGRSRSGAAGSGEGREGAMS